MTREKAIKWMQVEKASLERAPDLNGCPMTADWQEAIDVYDMAISALRAQQDNSIGIEAIKPMTLDELRQMNGEPVWIEPNDSCPPHWRIWSNSEPFDMAVFKAYRRKPEEGTV